MKGVKKDGRKENLRRLRKPRQSGLLYAVQKAQKGLQGYVPRAVQAGLCSKQSAQIRKAAQ